jgi:hypothetical protein
MLSNILFEIKCLFGLMSPEEHIEAYWESLANISEDDL